MTDIEKLVVQYLELRSQKIKLDSDISRLEQQLADYCRQNKRKSLSFKDQILSVVQKSKTVFPSKSDPRRQELEKILKSFEVTNQFKAIDIIKLASAYDFKKLPNDLILALKPLALSKPYIRISLLSASRHT